MRFVLSGLALSLVVVACSSSSSSTGLIGVRTQEGNGVGDSGSSTASDSNATEPPDSGEEEASVSTGDTNEAGSDVVTGRGGVGICAQCTVQQCLPQLQACDSPCLGALQVFNDCYGKSTQGSATCGAAFAQQGAREATLWACLQQKCPVDCS
jgi:hypothetical protein